MIAYLYLFNNNFYYYNNDLHNLYQTVIDQVGVSLCVLFLITHSILVKLKPNKILWYNVICVASFSIYTELLIAFINETLMVNSIYT